MTNFAAKNNARRRCRNGNPVLYAEGRANRALMANNGAFGRLPAKLFNLCCVGTTSLPRQPKISETELHDQPTLKRQRRRRSKKGAAGAVQG